MDNSMNDNHMRTSANDTASTPVGHIHPAQPTEQAYSVAAGQNLAPYGAGAQNAGSKAGCIIAAIMGIVAVALMAAFITFLASYIDSGRLGDFELPIQGISLGPGQDFEQYNEALAEKVTPQVQAHYQETLGFTPELYYPYFYDSETGESLYGEDKTAGIIVFHATHDDESFDIRVALEQPSTSSIPTGEIDARIASISDSMRNEELIEAACEDLSRRLGLPKPLAYSYGSTDETRIFVPSDFDRTSAWDTLVEQFCDSRLSLSLIYPKDVDIDTAIGHSIDVPENKRFNLELYLNQIDANTQAQSWNTKVEQGAINASANKSLSVLMGSRTYTPFNAPINTWTISARRLETYPIWGQDNALISNSIDAEVPWEMAEQKASLLKTIEGEYAILDNPVQTASITSEELSESLNISTDNCEYVYVPSEKISKLSSDSGYKNFFIITYQAESGSFSVYPLQACGLYYVADIHLLSGPFVMSIAGTNSDIDW